MEGGEGESGEESSAPHDTKSGEKRKASLVQGRGRGELERWGWSLARVQPQLCPGGR